MKRTLNDTQVEWAEGRIVAFEETPQWCQVLLNNGREVTAVDPWVATDPDCPPNLNDRVVVSYVPNRYCLISTNEDRLARKSAARP
jgi:hypothetical protein